MSVRRTNLWLYMGLVLPLCFALGHMKRANVQANSSPPIVVLESSRTIHGLYGYKNVQMLVRLTKDGKAEWEQVAGNANARRVASIPAEQVASIRERLDAINKKVFRPRMGPFNTYTDTSAELEIKVLTSTGMLTFSVINPWPCDLPSCSLGKSKPLPREVKTIICEVSRLRAQLAAEPVYPMCESEESSQ